MMTSRMSASNAILTRELRMFSVLLGSFTCFGFHVGQCDAAPRFPDRPLRPTAGHQADDDVDETDEAERHHAADGQQDAEQHRGLAEDGQLRQPLPERVHDVTHGGSVYPSAPAAPARPRRSRSGRMSLSRPRKRR